MVAQIQIRLASLALTGLMVILLSGCAKTPEDLLRAAKSARDEAQKAAERQDATAAGHAAQRAESAVTQLKRLAESRKPQATNAQQLLGEAQIAARSARDHAKLADEETQLRKRLASLKLKAYRSARSLVLSYSLTPAALTAEKAAKNGTNSLSSLEQTLAEHAWNLVSLITERPAQADGSPDWPSAAADLRAWSTNPPIEFTAFLEISLLLLGCTDFALAELEAVDASRLVGTNDLKLYHAGRALIYALEGWDRAAGREMEIFSRLSPQESGKMEGNQVVAVFHGMLAVDALSKRELARADEEIARCLSAWPENPVAVFLTGERLAASGEWIKAADSLEARAAGTPDEWLAQRLAQRARDLRDGKGSAKALVLDPVFLLEVAARATAKTARDFAVAQKLERLVAEAKIFGKRVAEKLPGRHD